MPLGRPVQPARCACPVSARTAAPPPVAIARAPVVLTPPPQDPRVPGKVDSLGQTTLAAAVTNRIVGPLPAGGQAAAPLRPILMTMLADIGGFLPLAIGTALAHWIPGDPVEARA